jgi:hypothetical protein
LAATYSHEEVYWENKNILQENCKKKNYFLLETQICFKFIEKLFFKLSRKTTNISQGHILIVIYPGFANNNVYVNCVFSVKKA